MEKQRFKHIISLYYRAFLRCSWIKGPNFRTPMKAMGVLSPLKAGRCTPAHSRGRFKHTTKKHVQHPPLPAGGNVHLSFCLYFLLAAGHLEPHPRPGNPPFHRARHCPPRPWMQGEIRQQPCAPERCIPRALPWVQECPAWPPHHAAPHCDLHTQLPTCLLTTGIHLCEGITWTIRYPSSEFLHWLRACFSSLQSGTLTVSLLLLYYKPQPAPSPPPQSTSPMAFLSTWSQWEK